MASPRPPGAVRRRAAGASTTIGGVLVGFDEQVWRRQPPAQERVAQVDRANTVAAPGGLMIRLPHGRGDVPAVVVDDHEGTRPAGRSER